MIRVDDPHDERLADYRHLTDAEARRSIEARHGLFIVEGPLALERLLAGDHRIRSVLLSTSKADSLAGALDDALAARSAPVYVADRRVLESVAGFDVHRGVLASAERPAPRSLDELLTGARSVLVAEGVNDNENIGSLFRNAAALGVDAVLLDPACADPLYRRSIRVSSGWTLDLPWARVADAAECVTALRAGGWTTFALTPAPAAVDLDAALGPEVASRRVGWVVGAEGPGLRPATIDACDAAVRIPMRDGVDSLNVATSFAVAAAFLAAARGWG